MTLRRETIVPVLALLVIAAAIPFAIVDTFKTGRVHARPIMPKVLELAERGALRPELITTRVVGFADAPDALLERDWTKLVVARP